MPKGAIYVGRPTKWGNPFVHGGPDLCVRLYRQSIGNNLWTWANEYDIQKELRGKDLACWCRLCEKHKDGKPWDESCTACAPCHADVLLEISNSGECDDKA